jgi:hypothetical protein
MYLSEKYLGISIVDFTKNELWAEIIESKLIVRDQN